MTVHIGFRETFPFRATEWALAAMVTCWGAVVIVAPDMFGAAASFKGMAAIMPQPVWGLGALVLGILGLIALAVNGLWVATPFIRVVCALARCFFWMQVTLGFLVSNNPTTGLAIYPWLFVLDLWNIYRATKDARTATL